jgi:hypothetical protein
MLRPNYSLVAHTDCFLAGIHVATAQARSFTVYIYPCMTVPEVFPYTAAKRDHVKPPSTPPSDQRLC